MESLLVRDRGRSAEDGSAVVLSGPGVDPTGRTVSTKGVQALLDALPPDAVVAVPSGTVLSLDDTIHLRRPVRVIGSGEWRFIAGIGDRPALSVEADRAVVEDLRLTNPNRLGAATGPKSFGIWIAADAVTVRGCVVQGFQNGIAVSPAGEFHDVAILSNHVVDVLGVGGGPADRTSSLGEDRGDGIVVWGATAIVAGNHVSAMRGRDCRVGIHMEGLSASERRAWGHADAMNVVNGNVVTGSFRRGVVAESIGGALITGNAVADSTWWGIALIDGSGCVVSSNTVTWTRTADDGQGAAWAPSRGPIMVYGEGRTHLVSGNVLQIQGAADHGIAVQRRSAGGVDTVVDTNLLDVAAGGACTDGVSVLGATRARISGNQLVGVDRVGVHITDCFAFTVSGNTCQAATDGATGTFSILLEGAAQLGLVSGNMLLGSDVGVSAVDRNGITVSGNVIQASSVGVDLSGTSGAMSADNAVQAATAVRGAG